MLKVGLKSSLLIKNSHCCYRKRYKPFAQAGDLLKKEEDKEKQISGRSQGVFLQIAFNLGIVFNIEMGHTVSRCKKAQAIAQMDAPNSWVCWILIAGKIRN